MSDHIILLGLCEEDQGEPILTNDGTQYHTTELDDNFKSKINLTLN